MLYLDRYLLEQGASWRYFPILLAVGQDHFVQGVFEHFPALLDILPFGYHFRPLDQLTQVTRINLCVLGSKCTEHMAPLSRTRLCRASSTKAISSRQLRPTQPASSRDQ